MRCAHWWAAPTCSSTTSARAWWPNTGWAMRRFAPSAPTSSTARSPATGRRAPARSRRLRPCGAGPHRHDDAGRIARCSAAEGGFSGDRRGGGHVGRAGHRGCGAPAITRRTGPAYRRLDAASLADADVPPRPSLSEPWHRAAARGPSRLHPQPHRPYLSLHSPLAGLPPAPNAPAQFRQLSAVPGLQALCSNGQAIATWRHSTPRAAASSWRAILPHLRGCFIEAFATRSAVEMEQQINAVGVPAARVRRLGGFLDEAQGMPGTGWQPTVYRQAPGAGEVRTPGLGFRYRFDGASDSAGAPAPGRDNQALLAALARPVPATPSADRAGAVPVSG